MSKKIILALILLVVLIIGAFMYSKNAAPKNEVSTNSSNTRSYPKQAAPQKLADQPYAKNAYLISGDTLSADAKTALSGFLMDKKTLPDGSVQISLKAQEPQYHDQQYTLQASQQLYFIDKFLADDNSNREGNIGDDTAVIVDSEGNLVTAPSGF